MDTLLLEYKLKSCGIDRKALLDIMGWGESTRQARCIRGDNWRVDEVKNLIRLGMTLEEVISIFFDLDDHKSGHQLSEEG